MKILDFKDKINKTIDSSFQVFIMGHKYLDLDALGSAVGFYDYVTSRNKKATIIINDTSLEKGVKKVIDEIKSKYVIKKSTNIKYDSNSLLIAVDANKDYLFQDPELIDKFDNIIIVDHHDKTSKTVNKGLVIIDEDTSSVCEMLAEFLDETNTKISKEVATILLSGIVLDTNNFVIKTTKDTYKASYTLACNGADPAYVQYLLKQDFKKYTKSYKVISNAKKIGSVTYSVANATIKYRREDLARIADTLLQFDKTEASFVVGRLEDDSIGISARSLGRINVGKLLEKFNGGGDENEAGARINNINIKKVEIELKNIIKSIK
jgi:c-di-AMP phosphodiesterase-like protein